MALVLTAYDLVVRTADLPAGVAAFARAVPNATFCTDGTLARAAFMDARDREQFAASLFLPASALARADQHTLKSDADWLECGRYAGVEAVWLRSGPREPLVVPIRWTPGHIQFTNWEEMKEHLEYLGREGDVEVYRDRRTGQKLYAGRTQSDTSAAEQERIQGLLARANELVKPFLLRQEKPGFFERRTLRKGIALFQEVVTAVPDHWPALWTLGMSLRALGEEEAALPHFRRAYQLNPSQSGVGRELAGQCMRLGLGEEAVRISRDLHARFPDDVGLQSNLALALLIAGDVDEALVVAQAALAREPSDPVTRALVGLIGRVKAGAAPRPTRMPGM
jgi:tetratricopeptide (TPR) repeat protein